MKSSVSLLTLVTIYRQHIAVLAHTTIFRWQALRGFCAAMGSWAWILSLQHLSLATSSALSLTSALLTSIGGILFFKEKVGWQLAGCILLGFGGVLMVLQPTSDIFTLYALLPLVSALAFSSASLLVKVLCQTDRSETTLLYMLFFMTIISLPFAMYHWHPVTHMQVLKMVAIGILYAFTQLMLIEAYTHAMASFIAPFKYMRFPLNLSAEILFFTRWPKFHEIWGGVIIAASSLYLVWREKQRRNKSNEPS
jgi:S-adenosylmethionine uptake transporter